MFNCLLVNPQTKLAFCSRIPGAIGPAAYNISYHLCNASWLRAVAPWQTRNCVLLAMNVLRRNPEDNSFSNLFPIIQAVLGTCFGYCQESDTFTMLLLAPQSQQIFCIPCVCHLAFGNNASFWNILWDDPQASVTEEPTGKKRKKKFFPERAAEVA